MPPPNSRRARTGGFLAACLLATAILAWAAPLEADDAIQAPTAETPLALLVTADGTAIWRETGIESLDLPDGVGLTTLQAIDGGWVAAGNRWEDGETELFLLRSVAGETTPVAPPPGRLSLRGGPALVVGDGRLEGIVWLEGQRQENLVVLAARWDGGAWGDPEVVSPPGPGAQLALSAAVLDGGAWLVVWAAVDGEDDEILWSFSPGESWSAPTRIHENNTVPDITPAVAPLAGGGAIVVWSALDDRHYRLRSSRFDGARWELDAPFGADGSTRPGFVFHGLERYLLYRSVVPDTWSLLELDGDGIARRRADALTPVGRRPVLDLRDPGAVFLHWPGLASGPRAPAVPIPWQDLE